MIMFCLHNKYIKNLINEKESNKCIIRQIILI